MTSPPIQRILARIELNPNFWLSILIPTLLNPVLILHLVTLLSMTQASTTGYHDVCPAYLDVHAHPLAGFLMTFILVSGQFALYWIASERLVDDAESGNGTVWEDKANMDVRINTWPET